jgi:catechol 2,3-dioxygenase-like lactoylglutathione lyase family enzyme
MSERPYRVKMMFHPTIHVRSLDEAEEFYARVFGRTSANISTVFTPRADHASDYSTFTPVADVLLDDLEPKRYVTNGEQRYPDIEFAHLKTTGWFVDGAAELYRELARQGIRVTNSRDQLLTDPEPPAGVQPFHSLPDDAGIRYHFFESFPFPLDPRAKDGWTLTPAADDDPLGIEFAAHHTILTSQPERALRLTVDILGGEVIHQGRDDLRAAAGPYVHLADAVFHYATPEPGSEAAADHEAGSHDTYHAITWKVADLGRAARHLQSQGVRIAHQSATTLVTDPATSLGIPWGFTTELVPGDPRASHG